MERVVARHWPEYLMEAAGLGLFMISAAVFTTLLFHPASPLAQIPLSPVVRRLLVGIAMGATAVALIYCPWGQQSGAHFNPAVTLTFFRLGKVAGVDAACYVVAQSVGGLTGMLVAAVVLGRRLADPSVNYVVTVPGGRGTGVAFAAELVITFVLMLTVLAVSNAPAMARWTGVCAGVLVAIYVTIEAPLSGMSMNPARTLASAVPADVWTGFWVYLVAPVLGMLLAAEIHLRLARRPVACAKLHHATTRRCIFRCGYAAGAAR